MGRETIYGGNISVLLAIIFFLGLSSDALGQSVSDTFIEFALLLFAVAVFCTLSLTTLIFVDALSLPENAAKILCKISFYFLACELILLLAFTFKFIVFSLELAGW